ncbi:hypothetical protein AVEN_107814-1 [Araneus ventricosus]|uniref:Uncharacterized protein n=1 Tax=Araneus ventricosus TaxID=182803 RepID=A0A4Y2MAQ1_ARAVE|nr:hypothetical protein AVEN_107814-1 [Araneus ventricosus]
MQDFDSLRLVKCRLSDECTKHVPRNVLVVLPAGAHALSGLRRARSQELWKDQGFQFLDRRCTRMTGRTAGIRGDQATLILFVYARGTTKRYFRSATL